jgi:hypothetical protein
MSTDLGKQALSRRESTVLDQMNRPFYIGASKRSLSHSKWYSKVVSLGRPSGRLMIWHHKRHGLMSYLQ